MNIQIETASNGIATYNTVLAPIVDTYNDGKSHTISIVPDIASRYTMQLTVGTKGNTAQRLLDAKDVLEAFVNDGEIWNVFNPLNPAEYWIQAGERYADKNGEVHHKLMIGSREYTANQVRNILKYMPLIEGAIEDPISFAGKYGKADSRSVVYMVERGGDTYHKTVIYTKERVYAYSAGDTETLLASLDGMEELLPRFRDMKPSRANGNFKFDPSPAWAKYLEENKTAEGYVGDTRVIYFPGVKALRQTGEKTQYSQSGIGFWNPKSKKFVAEFFGSNKVALLVEHRATLEETVGAVQEARANVHAEIDRAFDQATS